MPQQHLLFLRLFFGPTCLLVIIVSTGTLPSPHPSNTSPTLAVTVPRFATVVPKSRRQMPQTTFSCAVSLLLSVALSVPLVFSRLWNVLITMHGVLMDLVATHLNFNPPLNSNSKLKLELALLICNSLRFWNARATTHRSVRF